MSFVAYAMTAAGACYVAAAVGWAMEKNWWMCATFVLYAMTAATLYFAGKS